MLTLITNIYNEASLLLADWLVWHKRFFDHLIVLDYNSDDGSIELIKTIWSTAEIHSTEEEFGAWANDEKIMQLERTVQGWKMALNTTEYLLTDPKPYMDVYKGYAIGCRSVIMVDGVEEHNKTLVDSPLVFQRHNGYLDNPDTPSSRRWRFMHNFADGAYHVGRHYTNHPHTHEPDMLIKWMGFSPYPQIKERKLQIQNKMPISDKKAGLGGQHVTDPAALDREYERLRKLSSNLLDNDLYRTTLEALGYTCNL